MNTNTRHIISTSWLYFSIALATLFAGVFFIHSAYGQEEDIPIIPNISTQAVTVTSSTPSSVTGTFTAYNTANDYIGNLTYNYIILGPRPEFSGTGLVLDDAAVYAVVASNEQFALSPSEKKEIPFTLTEIPALPQGEYRLRIEIRTEDDRITSWADAPVTLGEGSSAFGIIESGLVLANSQDPITEETLSEWLPDDGVNLDAGQDITLQATIRNAGTTELTGTIQIVTQKALLQDALPTTTTGPLVTIPANQTSVVDIPFTAPTDSGVYISTVTLLDSAGATRSSMGIYRTVTRGVSASILRATLNSPATAAGDKANVSFSLVGSADRVTDTEGTVTVDILSGTSVIGTSSLPITLTASPTSGDAIIELTENATDTLGLRITVADSTGNTLATSTSTFPNIAITPLDTESPQQESSSISAKTMVIVGVIVAILILLGTIIALTMRSRKNSGFPPSTPAISILLLLAGSTLAGIFFVTSLTNADNHYSTYEETQDETGIYIRETVKCENVTNNPEKKCDVNRHHLYTNITPLQGIEYGEQITYDLRLEWYACSNSTNYSALDVLTLQDGGLHVNSTSQAENNNWNLIARQDRSKTGNSSGWNKSTYFGVTSFPNPLPSNRTTLWVDAYTETQRLGQTYRIDHDAFRWLTFGSGEDTGSGISITKQGNDTASIGSLLSYSVRVSNAGPETATDIVVTDPIPSGVTFNSSASSAACVESGENIECSLDSIAAGGSTFLAIAFDIPEEAICNSTVSNTASVTSSTTDSNPSNNTSSTIETTLTCGVCADEEDNDGDGLVDADDPACHEGHDINLPYDPTRPSEDDTQCTDGIDNDEDGLVDEADFGCHEDGTLDTPFVPSHNDESNNPIFDPGVIIEDD